MVETHAHMLCQGYTQIHSQRRRQTLIETLRYACTDEAKHSRKRKSCSRAHLEYTHSLPHSHLAGLSRSVPRAGPRMVTCEHTQTKPQSQRANMHACTHHAHRVNINDASPGQCGTQSKTQGPTPTRTASVPHILRQPMQQHMPDTHSAGTRF